VPGVYNSPKKIVHVVHTNTGNVIINWISTNTTGEDTNNISGDKNVVCCINTIGNAPIDNVVIQVSTCLTIVLLWPIFCNVCSAPANAACRAYNSSTNGNNTCCGNDDNNTNGNVGTHNDGDVNYVY